MYGRGGLAGLRPSTSGRVASAPFFNNTCDGSSGGDATCFHHHMCIRRLDCFSVAKARCSVQRCLAIPIHHAQHLETPGLMRNLLALIICPYPRLRIHTHNSCTATLQARTFPLHSRSSCTHRAPTSEFAADCCSMFFSFEVASTCPTIRCPTIQCPIIQRPKPG